jgi:hypothetical protein
MGCVGTGNILEIEILNFNSIFNLRIEIWNFRAAFGAANLLYLRRVDTALIVP